MRLLGVRGKSRCRLWCTKPTRPKRCVRNNMFCRHARRQRTYLTGSKDGRGYSSLNASNAVHTSQSHLSHPGQISLQPVYASVQNVPPHTVQTIRSGSSCTSITFFYMAFNAARHIASGAVSSSDFHASWGIINEQRQVSSSSAGDSMAM